MLSSIISEPCVRAGSETGDDSVGTMFAALYPQLRRLARARLRDGGRDAVLDTTALVHESYLRLAAGSGLRCAQVGAFMLYAGRAMRSVIVDLVRKRQALRRGSGAAQVTLNTDVVDSARDPDAEQIERVHEALGELAALDARLAAVVEMRWFAGMCESEIAAALGVNERTVRRDWDKARVLLAGALK